MGKKCLNCLRTGHTASECKEQYATCYNCGMNKHRYRDCPEPTNCWYCEEVHAKEECPNVPVPKCVFCNEKHLTSEHVVDDN